MIYKGKAKDFVAVGCLTGVLGVGVSEKLDSDLASMQLTGRLYLCGMPDLLGTRLA